MVKLWGTSSWSNGIHITVVKWHVAIVVCCCWRVVFFRFILHHVCISLTISMFSLNCGLSVNFSIYEYIYKGIEALLANVDDVLGQRCSCRYTSTNFLKILTVFFHHDSYKLSALEQDKNRLVFWKCCSFTAGLKIRSALLWKETQEQHKSKDQEKIHKSK